jgi:hypothetical protein
MRRVSFMDRIKSNLPLAAFTAMAIESASAHDMGCDGNPVPETIKSDCCGEGEEHRLIPEQISRGPNNEYIVSFEGYTFVIPAGKAQPSKDACSLSSSQTCGW